MPCFPLFAAVAGAGVERLLRRIPVSLVAGGAAALATTLAFGYSLVHLEYGDMGQYGGTQRAALPVWKTEQDATLLLADAGARPDLCGVAVLGARAGFTGGYTYLHRDVPLTYEGQLCDPSAVNYIIRSTEPGAPALPASYILQSQRGSWGIYHRQGACRPRQKDDDRLLEGARDMGLVRRQAKQHSDGSLRFDLRRDSGAFVQNWGHGETIDCEMARWAAGKYAALEFDFSPDDAEYQLVLRARPHEGALPQTLSVVVNGERVPLVSMSPNLKSYTVELPEQGLRTGRNRIEFRFGRAVRAGVNDARELAAIFRSIEIIPREDDFVIDVALAESRSHLAHGFHATEQEGSFTFAWSSGPTSEIEGTLASARSPYVLETLAEAVPLASSQRARVFANDAYVGTLDFPANGKVSAFSFPPPHCAKERIGSASNTRLRCGLRT